MKLYGFDPGPFPRRVMLYLALKGLDNVEVISLNIFKEETKTPEFLAKNPGGNVPILETDDGNYVYETQAIMQYLEEAYPEHSLSGETEAERLRVDMQCDLINEWYHSYYLSAAHIFPYLSKSKVQAQDVNIVTSPLWRTRLEQINEIRGNDPFLAGAKPTIPDCLLFPIFEYTRVTYDAFIPPHLKGMLAWFENFKALPGIPLLDLPDWYHDELFRRHGTRI
ncbi:glutathione S-transferase family protein [Novosphingobium sp. AP12]|uniref:glutathione S-transferase family protein n=1 Tax=Novosphingobium sp. AP12 TaxID=1144305 RepID=UPI000272001C|nr:glutathione S-transferase family protein [Novosphingobium sp. AP12]EJL30860.1 glutathione S-transferase [Novosphingobium sp. AP12]